MKQPKMIKNLFAVLLVILLLSPSQFNAQNSVGEKLQTLKQHKQTTPLALLNNVTSNTKSLKYTKSLPIDLQGKAQYYNINPSAVNFMRENDIELLTLPLTLPSIGDVNVSLYRQSIFSADFVVTSSQGDLDDSSAKKIVFYRGVVDDMPNSLVSITILEDGIIGVISVDGINYNLGQIKDAKTHILYKSTDLSIPSTFICGTSDLTIEELESKPEIENPSNLDKTVQCVRLRVEVDNGLTSVLGGNTNSVNYVAGLFNEVLTLYANDNIDMLVSEVFIWEGSSPYSGGAGNILDQMTNNSPNADLTTLLSTQSNGGIAYLSGLCSTSFGNNFNSVDGFYSNVPSYSWDVNVVAHEIGHNLSSDHTHACSWNGNNTAIDGCGPDAGYSEGCDAALPPNGGTIMSYCHLTNVGVNFNLGFGTQPGNRIRNYINNSSCLGTLCSPADPSCDDGIMNGNETGIDCGGDCAPCPTCDDGIQNGTETDVDCGGSCTPCNCDGDGFFLTLTFDDYAYETSWQITNAGGTIVASGDGYAEVSGTSIAEPICLSVGCYDLTVFDSFGDGMCCAYGNGGYSLTNSDGTVLTSGGVFGSSDTFNFCVEGTPAPTCNGNIPARFTLVLDGEPHENKWELFHEDNYIAAQGYGYGGQNNATIIEDLCLAEGCYRFAISDMDGDGICCQYGNGSFVLENLQTNSVILQGGDNVGLEQIIYFCIQNNMPTIANSEGVLRSPEKQVKSTELNTTKNQIRLFPNPSKDKIHLVTTKDLSKSATTIEVFNGSGQKMIRQEIGSWESGSEITLDVESFPSGVYSVSISSDAHQFNLKFVKL